MEITIDINTRIKWIKDREALSPQAEELIRFQMQDMAINIVTEVATTVEKKVHSMLPKSN